MSDEPDDSYPTQWFPDVTRARREAERADLLEQVNGFSNSDIRRALDALTAGRAVDGAEGGVQ